MIPHMTIPIIAEQRQKMDEARKYLAEAQVHIQDAIADLHAANHRTGDELTQELIFSLYQIISDPDFAHYPALPNSIETRIANLPSCLGISREMVERQVYFNLKEAYDAEQESVSLPSVIDFVLQDFGLGQGDDAAPLMIDNRPIAYIIEQTLIKTGMPYIA